MATDEGAMSLFPEIFTATKKLNDAQFGALIRAGREYQMTGEEYSGDDLAVDIAFQFLSSQIDRRKEANSKKTDAANKRWSKAPCTPMQSDAQSMQTPCTPMQSDAPIHSIPIHSIPIHSSKSKADDPPDHAPEKEARKPYGDFGWVKLTESEYNRLLNDLGEAEVKRCIAYVDESAQLTKNKNKWRDWSLVLRKCSREGWGISAKFQTGRKEIPKGASGILGSAEMDAIRRVLEEP